MSRTTAIWSTIFIFGTLSTSALAVPIFSNTLANEFSIGGSPPVQTAVNILGLGTDTVAMSFGVAVSTGGPPIGGSIGGVPGTGANMYTDGPIAPAVLHLRWFEDSDGGGCCITGGDFGGSVWDWETGSPVLIYSWLGSNNGPAGEATLPFKVGIPFEVDLNASLTVEWLNRDSSFPPSFNLNSVAVIGIEPITTPEPGSFMFLLTGLGAGGAFMAFRRRRQI